MLAAPEIASGPIASAERILGEPCKLTYASLSVAVG